MMKKEREIMNQVKNRHAKMKDMGRIYSAATSEANLTASAMITILANMLIDKHIFTAGEIEAYLSEEKICEMREIIRVQLSGGGEAS